MQIIWFAVFQYCFVRVFCTFMALIAQAVGRYCVDSLSPLFAHVWVCRSFQSDPAMGTSSKGDQGH